MKKKFCIAFSALACMCILAFGMTACAHKHTFSADWKTNATHHWHACECGEKDAYAAHDFGEWTVLVDATETAVGSRKHACKTCGYEQTEEIPVKEHEHTFADAYSYDESEHWLDATCGHDEESGRGKHTLSGGKCSVCGYTDPSVLYDFTTAESGDGYSISVKTSAKSKTSFVIPSSYKGKAVVEIAEQGFSKVAAKTLTIPASIKRIGKYAFWQSKLEQVAIPDTVETIGAIFYQCDYIKDVTIGNGVKDIPAHTFRETPALATVRLGSSVQTIGDYAFYKCAITKVTLPDSVQTLGASAFKSAESLETAVLGKGIKTIPESCFYKCAKLKPFSLANITSVGNFAFNYCTNFAADVPESVTIGEKAFQASGVKSVVWKKSYTSTWEFENCTNLQSVTFTDTVTKIADAAFRNCSSLKTIIIGKNVGSISDKAFMGCTARETLVVAEENASYKSENNMLLNKAGTILKLTNAAGDVPSTVSAIAPYAFYGHKTITTFDCPANVKNINSYAFYGCEKLKSVTFPPNANKGANAVGSHAFACCPELETVVIPEKTTSFSQNVFEGCEKLKSVRFENTSGWIVFVGSRETPVDVSNPEQNVIHLTQTYLTNLWTRRDS